MLKSSEVERQLVQRRLDFEALQKSIKQLEARISTLSGDSSIVTTTQKQQQAVTIQPKLEEEDIFWNGTAIEHRLQHWFRKAVQFFGTVTFPGLTASRPLKLSAANVVSSDQIDLSSSNDIKNVLTVPNGGTGLSTISAHYVLVGNGTGNIVPVAPSTAGYILTSNGASADPSFAANVAASDYIKVTPEGGTAIKMINKTGGNTVKGKLVHPATVTRGFDLVPVDNPDIIGCIYDDNIADGNECWVVVGGIAEVYFVGNTSIGNFARMTVTADTGAAAGCAIAEALPSTPFATDKHFMEIGHVIEARTGAGLAKIVMHFN